MAVTLIKGKILIEVAAHSIIGLAHYHHGRKHSSWEYGDVEADMVLEKVLRILHLDPQATGRGLRHWAWFEH